MAKDKIKKFSQLAYEYIRKKLIKPSKGGITSLPTDKEISSAMLEMFEKLRGAGYNVTNIGKEVRNADDLGFLINKINQAELENIKKRKDAAEGIETVIDKLNKGIPLNPGDQMKIEGAGFKTTLDAFKGFKPKVIQGGKSEGIKSLDLAKELEELTNKNLKERGLGEIKLGDKLPPPKNKKLPVDPKLQAMENQNKMFEDFSTRNMTGIEAQKEASALIGRKGKYENISKSDAEKKLNELQEIINKANAEPDLGKKKMIEDFKEKNERALEDFVDEAGGTKEGVEFDDEPFDAAQGGRIGMFKGGGLFKFLSENSPFQAYKKYLQSVKRRSIEGDFKSLAPELGAVSAGGILVNRKMKSILEDMKEQDNERLLKEFKADLDKDPFYKKYPDMKDKAIEKYTERMFGDKKAMGGRIGFKEGSGMSRRTFLKLLGGLASIPFVGKFFKPAAKATKAVEVASKSSGVPAYFPKLVEKIQLLGNDVSRTRATGERQIVKEYKGYELTEEMDTGKLTIKRDNYTSEEYLQFEPGGSYYDETRKKVIKYPDEYEEVTVKPDYEGKMKDVDYGLDNIDEIMKEVDMIETDYKIAPGGKPRDKKSGGGLAYMMGE